MEEPSMASREKWMSIMEDRRQNADMPLSTMDFPTKAMPCHSCDACRSPECLECRWCRDKKKYGGPGKLNKRCILRRCKTPRLEKMYSNPPSLPTTTTSKMTLVQTDDGGTFFIMEESPPPPPPRRTVYQSEGGLLKEMPCRACGPCLREDCGLCNPCRDKRKFGGRAVND